MELNLTIFKITEEKKNIKIHKKKLMKLRPSLKLQKKKEKIKILKFIKKKINEIKKIF